LANLSRLLCLGSSFTSEILKTTTCSASMSLCRMLCIRRVSGLHCCLFVKVRDIAKRCYSRSARRLAQSVGRNPLGFHHYVLKSRNSGILSRALAFVKTFFNFSFKCLFTQKVHRIFCGGL
jgi:hypothetical protein